MTIPTIEEFEKVAELLYRAEPCNKWTTDQPRVVGLYWVKWKGFEKIELVWIHFVSGRIVVECFANKIKYRDDEFTHWLGPLQIPDFEYVVNEWKMQNGANST